MDDFRFYGCDRVLVLGPFLITEGFAVFMNCGPQSMSSMFEAKD